MNNLNTKLIKNFLFLIFIFIFMMWFFQTFLLNSSYKTFRKNDIKKAFNSVISLSDRDYLEKLSNKNESYIFVFDNNYNLEYGTYSIPRGLEREILNKVKTSNFELIDEEIVLSRLNNNYNLYGNKKGDKYLLFVSKLDPINSTTSIIGRQLIYVSIVSIIIAILISLKLSKKLSNPIKKINETSKELGKGNFNITFNESNYLEVKELSNTLNDTVLKLKEKDTIQKDIISNVSHDLKTPLTIIKGYAEVIRDTKSKEKDKYLNNIIEETDNLNDMINNILEVSKLENNNYLNLNYIDISKLVDTVLKRLSKIIEDNNINIIYNKKKLIVNVDKNKIEQVIYNLILNGINHVGKDKILKINITDKLEIIDHGKGIEDTTHIFDKYYTTHNNTSNGLGLYIVKTILDKHNLKYGVESKKDKFTKFFIKF